MSLLSISRCVTELARRDPDRPAVIDEDGTLTRHELDLRTNALARAYAGLGDGPGALVTIALPNGRAFVEACVAVWKLGGTPQPVSARLPPAELAAVIALADPVLVVGADAPGRTSVEAGLPLPDDTSPLVDAVSQEWKAPT